MSEITDQDLNEALDRIARTPDGLLLYRFLQQQLLGVLAEYAPDKSALRVQHGERRFAQSLMGRMAKGIDESGGSTGSSSTRASERPVVFRRAERQPAAGVVSYRDYARANDPEYTRIAGSLTGDRGSGG